MKRTKSLTLVSLFLITMLLLGACSQATPTPTPAPKPATTQAPSTPTLTPTPTPKPTITQAPSTPTPVAKALKPLPSIIEYAGPGATATGTAAMAIGDALGKQLGIKVSYQNYGTYLAQSLALKTGRALLLAGSTS